MNNPKFGHIIKAAASMIFRDQPITEKRSIDAAGALKDNIAILTLNSPPVNALSAPVREGLDKGIRQAIKDSRVDAIIHNKFYYKIKYIAYSIFKVP